MHLKLSGNKNQLNPFNSFPNVQRLVVVVVVVGFLLCCFVTQCFNVCYMYYGGGLNTYKMEKIYSFSPGESCMPSTQARRLSGF